MEKIFFQILLHLRQMRLTHWVKNLLIFLPFFFITPSLLQLKNSIIYFLCFSLMASCTYILNDFLDSDSDRKHPVKKNRPYASLQLNTKQCTSLFLFLFLFFLFGLFQISEQGIFWIFCYLSLTLSYSFFLKKIMIIDLIALSTLYLIRIKGGFSIVHGVDIPFLFLFGFFLFFFGLASFKRIIEINSVLAAGEKVAKVKAYNQNHLDFLNLFFYVPLVFSSLLVLFFLFNQEEAINQKGNLFLAFLLILWKFRLFYIKERNKISSLLLTVLKDKIFIVIYISLFLFVCVRTV